VSGQIGTAFAPELMRIDAREKVIDLIARLPVTPALRRQLLIEWARQVGTRLEPGELQRVSDGYPIRVYRAVRHRRSGRLRCASRMTARFPTLPAALIWWRQFHDVPWLQDRCWIEREGQPATRRRT